VIAAGGILTVADAEEKHAAGAALVQLYSGLIYKGPTLINKLLKASNCPQ
jgi:dihydroorotate dehydrogenase